MHLPVNKCMFNSYISVERLAEIIIHLNEIFVRPAAKFGSTYRTDDSNILSYPWHLHLTHKYSILGVKNCQPKSFKVSFENSYVTHLTAKKIWQAMNPVQCSRFPTSVTASRDERQPRQRLTAAANDSKIITIFSYFLSLVKIEIV